MTRIITNSTAKGKEQVPGYVDTGRLSRLIHRVFTSESMLMLPFQILLRIVFHLEISGECFKKGLFLIHPYNIILHKDARLGSNVTIYHNVTVATVWDGKKKGTPVLEDNVIIYPHSIILGNCTVGKNSIIGAGSVVLESVPPNSIVAGNPARVIGTVTDKRPIEIRRYY
jgi:serine acetyltransferase